MLILKLAIAFLLAKTISFFIDKLYIANKEALSFPDKKRPWWRIPFLTLGFTIAAQLSLTTFSLAGFTYFFYIVILIIITSTDFEQHLIFDKTILLLCLGGIFHIIAFSLPITDFLLASLAGGLIFFLLTIITKGGIGGGDIKLIFALGLWLGTDYLSATAILGIILGGIAAFILLISKKKQRHDYFAYGPYFAISAIIMSLQVKSLCP